MNDLFDSRRSGPEGRRFRRGIYLLPSLMTVGNMFCGYACVVHAMRGDLQTAAPLIGFAIVLDMLDGRIARLTGTSSAFAAGFIYVSATAMRLARFNIHSPAQLDKRYFVGMPSPPAAGIVAATVFAWPYPLTQPVELSKLLHEPAPWQALAAIVIMLVPAALMVSTVRFRSFKAINFGWGPSYMPLLLFILLVTVIYAQPQVTLLLLAYGYLASAFIGMVWTRFRLRRGGRSTAA